jgi:NADH:ubiquinone oxidoreductase subunit E
MPVSFSEEAIRRIDGLRQSYPEERSLLIPVLKIAQEEFGHLSPEVMDCVGELLDIPSAVLAGVATFYHNLFTGDRGRHVIDVCRTLSCELAGAREIAWRLKDLLDVDMGGTTDDGLITLRCTECLASCGSGPTLLIDEAYYEGVTAEACEGIVAALRDGNPPEGSSGIPGGPLEAGPQKEPPS